MLLTIREDIYFRTGELGYWIGEEHWGRGIMSRVIPAFVEWTWSTFGILVRLNGLVTESNAGSSRLLEKAGFVLEGRREDAICKNGHICAELMYGALRPA
jgi:RimJ/RimL family protein N-acetyltransferase